MSILVKNNARLALLACFVLLGMQLWFPLAVHAAEVPTGIGETSAPPTGSEDEGGAAELDLDADLVAHNGGLLRMCHAQRITPLPASREDRSGFLLLRAAGLQPAAP